VAEGTGLLNLHSGQLLSRVRIPLSPLPQMRYCVYILWSVKAHRTYVGQTEDVENRLDRHNRGLVRSTKAYRPWVLVYVEECATRSEAIKLESWPKSPSGRKWISGVMQCLT
jgi:putative endonuclease